MVGSSTKEIRNFEIYCMRLKEKVVKLNYK